ncbi:cell wall metabolism sensor histidine kinase WalK [uncultured Sphingomonas sp.]|uniref:sensor histidine kinase n=1 Tax=uncultured Sphingomonas sp. TaxID=158754 RepID=UPI0026379B73|nr:HAMP domain-containing sensor histidine kinase [uncultured Sphingomonas sp.]
MTRRDGLPLAAAVALLASIATLAVLFLHTADRGAALFGRAALSQAQFGDVLAIHAAAQSGEAPALAAALARYRADIAAERRLVGAGGPHDERIDAAAMAALVGAQPPRLAGLSRLVALAAARERAEADVTARQMAALRSRSRGFALLLAACAALSALVGAAGLRLANRRLERAVADRTARLVGVDASRRLFFAKVSHELRTPVTVMRGEAEVALATGPGDAEVLGLALREVVMQSEQLDRRIGELLALSQADDGRLALNDVPLDLAAIVGSAVTRARRHAASHGVQLTTTAASGVAMRGDARWLEQALVAVIDNAIKFSGEGDVVDIGLTRHGASAQIGIADRGCGSLPDALPRLFDTYYQTDEGRARGGSGLGLALVRWVAERHGGTVRAAARDGGGCIVTLVLPVTA